MNEEHGVLYMLRYILFVYQVIINEIIQETLLSSIEMVCLYTDVITVMLTS